MAPESAAAPRTSSRVDASGQPPSWPSAAARAAAYGSSPRETAADVPAALTGRLPPWLNGTYIRNGPGTLEGMVREAGSYGGGAGVAAVFVLGHACAGSGKHPSAPPTHSPPSTPGFTPTLPWQTHRFDGYAMLTRLDINGRENTVHASHRWLLGTAKRVLVISQPSGSPWQTLPLTCLCNA